MTPTPVTVRPIWKDEVDGSVPSSRAAGRSRTTLRSAARPRRRSARADGSKNVAWRADTEALLVEHEMPVELAPTVEALVDTFGYSIRAAVLALRQAIA